MDGNTIGLIITGVIAFILLTSIFWGIKRGLKKTFFRLIWLILTTIILAFTINPLSNWLNSFDLTKLNLNLGGDITKFSDIGVNLLKSIGLTEEILADSPALASLAENLPTMILNVILFVVVFWLAKAILWPLWVIISGAIFDKQARLEKKAKKEAIKKQKELDKAGNIDTPKQENVPQVITIKQNKHRGWGAFFGLVMGLLVCAVTFSPVAGLNSIFQTAYSSITIEEDGKQVPYLSTVMDTKTLEMVNCYQNSVGSKVLTYTGMGALSSAVFNGLATVEVDNQKVYLADEVNTFVNLYKNIVTIQSIDMENLTQESIDILLTTAEKIFVDSEGSKILYLVGDELIPYFIDEFLEQENITIIDGDVIDQIIIDTYRSSVDFALKEFRDEISAVIDIAFELNKVDLLAPIINEEVTTLDQLAKLVGTNVEENYTQKFSKNIVDSFYKIKMLEGENTTTIVKSAIETIFNSLDITYQEQEVTFDAVRNGLQTILQNTVSFCQVYAKADGIDFGEKSSTALSSIGSVLDYVKNNLFSEQNYNNLVDYLKTSLIDLTSGLGDFTTIANSISQVTSWKDELDVISIFYSAVIKVSESSLTIEDIANGNTELIVNLGTGLKSAVGNSKIINNNNIRIAIEEILKTISLGKDVDNILAIEVDSGVTLKNYILNNVYNNGVSAIKNWEDEFDYNIALFVNAYNLVVDGFDVDALSQTGNTKLEELGTSIDKALENTKLVVSHKVLRAVLEDLLDNKAELGTEVKEMLAFKDSSGISVLNNILNTIYNGTNGEISFAEELKTAVKAFSDLTKLDISNISKDNISSVGSVLDTLSQSKILNKHIVATILSNYTDKLTTSMDETFKTKVQPFVDGIKQNFEEVDSFETELSCLVDLLNFAEKENLVPTEIGQKFDTILETSKLIEKENITALINGIFDDFITTSDNGLKSAIQEIKSNIPKIESYKTEFKHLDNLINCLDKTLMEVGAQIDSILSANSKLITKNNVTSIIKSLIGDFITHTDTQLDAVLSKVKDSILLQDASTQKNNIEEIENYATEFNYVNGLIESLDKSLSEIGEKIDSILEAGSKLITKDEINIIVKHFFDKESYLYKDGDFANIISSLEIKVTNATSYKKAFEELNDMIGYIGDFSNLQTVEQFKSANTNSALGKALDDIASQTCVGDKSIAYNMTKILLRNLKDNNQSIATDVDDTINNEPYNFSKYEQSGNYPEDSAYYTNLVDALLSVI